MLKHIRSVGITFKEYMGSPLLGGKFDAPRLRKQNTCAYFEAMRYIRKYFIIITHTSDLNEK